MKLIDFIKSEAIEAGVRIGCTQAIRTIRGAITMAFPSPKAKAFLNSKVGQGFLSGAVGFGLGQAVDHQTVQTVAHECRVLGLARVGNGLVEHVTGSDQDTEKNS